MSEWQSPWAQRRYNKRKAAHECVNCGKQDDRTLRGLTFCEHCAVSRSAYERMYKDKKRASQKKSYIKDVQNHICPRCKQPLPEDYFFVVCESCRDRYKEYYRKKKDRRGGHPERSIGNQLIIF